MRLLPKWRPTLDRAPRRDNPLLSRALFSSSVSPQRPGSPTPLPAGQGRGSPLPRHPLPREPSRLIVSVAGFPALSPRPSLRSSLAHTTPIPAPIPTSVPTLPRSVYSKALHPPLHLHAPPAHARSSACSTSHANRCGATLPNPHAPLPLPPASSLHHHRTPAARPLLHRQPRLHLPHHVIPSPCPPSLPFPLPSLGTRSGLIPTPCVCGGLLSLRVLRMPVPPPTFSAPTARLFAVQKKSRYPPEKARLALGVATSRSLGARENGQKRKKRRWQIRHISTQ